MIIRYFFIAGAVTSSLAFALQESEYKINKQPSPIVAPYTVDRTDSRLLQPIKGTLIDTLNIGINIPSISPAQNKPYPKDIENLYDLGQSLLSTIYDFIRSAIILCIKMFIGA